MVIACSFCSADAPPPKRTYPLIPIAFDHRDGYSLRTCGPCITHPDTAHLVKDTNGSLGKKCDGCKHWHVLECFHPKVGHTICIHCASGNHGKGQFGKRAIPLPKVALARELVAKGVAEGKWLTFTPLDQPSTGCPARLSSRPHRSEQSSAALITQAPQAPLPTLPTQPTHAPQAQAPLAALATLATHADLATTNDDDVPWNALSLIELLKNRGCPEDEIDAKLSELLLEYTLSSISR